MIRKPHQKGTQEKVPANPGKKGQQLQGGIGDHRPDQDLRCYKTDDVQDFFILCPALLVQAQGELENPQDKHDGVWQSPVVLRFL